VVYEASANWCVKTHPTSLRQNAFPKELNQIFLLKVLGHNPRVKEAYRRQPARIEPGHLFVSTEKDTIISDNYVDALSPTDL
jgi:hypothetical protein